MRPWRKLHSNIVKSDRLGKVSDSAAALFFLLICGQDDLGVYPNAKVKLMALTITREWSMDQIRGFLGELEETNMVQLDEKAITIVDGVEKNGKIHKGAPLYYFDQKEIATDAISASWKPMQLPILELVDQIREEEIREEEIREEEIREDIDEIKSDDVDEVLQVYEDNVGKLGGMMRGEVKEWVLKAGKGQVLEAIRKALAQDKHTWAYIRAILENWGREGRVEREDLEDTAKYVKGKYGHLVQTRFVE